MDYVDSIHRSVGKFSREMESINMSHMEMLEMRNTIYIKIFCVWVY